MPGNDKLYDARIVVNVRKHERERAKQVAREHGLTLSEYIRALLRERARLSDIRALAR